MFKLEVRLARIVTIAFITIANFGYVLAQLPPPSDQSSGQFSPEIGFKVGGAYALGDIETINTVNGNLSLSIPLATLPAGRGPVSGSINLFYNSKLWNIRSETTVPTNSLGEPESRWYNLISNPYGSWRYGYKYELKVEDREYPILSSYNQNYIPCNNNNAIYYFKLFLIDPGGARQEFRLVGQNEWEGYFAYRPDGSTTNHCATVPPLHQKMVYYSMDGSYMRLEVDPDSDSNYTNNSWVLYRPDGSRVAGGGSVQRIYDRNQNYVEIVSGITYNTHNAIRIEDQFQRRIILEFGAAPQEDWIHSWGVGGIELITRIKWKTISVVRSYNNGFSIVPLLARFRSVVDQIILPNNLDYAFGYNAPTYDFAAPNNDPPIGWGELSSVTVPSGAQSTYRYTLDGLTTLEPAFVLQNAVSAKSLHYLQENDNPATPVTESWSYLFDFNGGVTRITGPDGGVTRTYYDASSGVLGIWSNELVYKTEYPDGSVVEKLWARNTPFAHPLSFYADNPYVKTEFVSKPDAAGVLTLTAIKDFKYDKNGNLTRLDEYDWVPYSSVPRSLGRPTGPPVGATAKRVTLNSYYAVTANAGEFDGGDAKQYHQASAPKLLGAIASTEIRQNGQPFTRTEFYYDSAFMTGNCIQVKTWDSQKGAYSSPLGAGNSISVSTTYEHGMPLISTDARGIQTRITYGQIGSVSDLYPTQIEIAFNTSLERTQTREYDFSTGLITRITDTDNGVSTSTTYDNFGRPTLVIAAEGKPEETRTITEYSDEQRRIISRSDLYAGGDGKRVSIQHFDQLGRLRLSRELESSSQDPTAESDGLKVQTRFRVSGGNTYQLVSNPYRAASLAQAASEATMGWTVSKFDKVGRILTVESFSGSSLPTQWGSNNSTSGAVTTAYNAGCSQSLCGSFTTVTDQAQKRRRSMTDGLGRLKRVDEPDASGNLGDLFSPNLPTDYAYDVSGNLVQVTQTGNGVTQNRYFSYSSLSRLISATNPESGTVDYKYDEGGNLIVKSDARIQPNPNRRASIHYAYDALNRLTRRWYNGSTSSTDTNHGNPALPDGVVLPDEARFYYDAQPLAGFSPGAPSFNRGYSAGRLVAVMYGPNASSSGDYFAYDALGRQTLKIQQTGGIDYKIAATYKPAGLSTMTYPSGHVVTYNFDAAGRLGDQDLNLAFTGNLGDGVPRTYARGITYESTGAMKEERLGTTTALYHKLAYNSRGQLTEIRVSTTANDSSWNRGRISNSYGTTNNNGNLLQQNVYVPTNDQGTTSVSWYQTYYYDSLNRLTGTHELNSGGSIMWGQFFDYDRFGNRTINQGNTSSVVNRMNYAVNSSNNRLVRPGGQSGMSYDAAGNLTGDTYTGAGWTGVETSAAVLNYDAENRLTSVQNNYGQSSQYGYDANGQRIKRTINGKETWQVYGIGGELLAEYRAGAAAFVPSKEYGYRNGQLLITLASGDDKRLARFVDNLYFGALQRDPTGTERTTAINQLAAAGKSGQTQLSTTAAAIARALFQSTNYESTRSLAQYVTDLYYAYTQRAPDSSGLNYWIGVVNNNNGNRQVALNGFEASSEFQTLTAILFGAATGDDQRTDQFINNLYLATTGAVATPAQLQQQRDRLNAAAAKGQVFVQDEAEEIGRELFASQVTNFSISEVQFVTNLYEGFLQRGPDTSGLNFWVSEAGTNNSTRRQNVLTSFAESGPFKDLAGTLYREVFWLIPDHLGTPRMLVDRTGSLSGIKRHDYLPFGEELFATVGSRTTALGYIGLDGMRQQFTSQERDNETGLDYFLARYYASPQGRFTSPDPTLLSVNALNPQSWNRYEYVLNNPLVYIDPLGLWELYYEDVYKTKKNKDGTETKVFDRRQVYARKSKDSDDAASLAKQLGLTGKDATKFAESIGGGDNIRLADQDGAVGRVFDRVESGLTEQVKWEAKHGSELAELAKKDIFGPGPVDCSRSAYEIGLGGSGLLQVGTNYLDPLLDTEAKAVSGTDLRLADIIRYAKSDNVATHFANFIFQNDDGTPVAFSKSGEHGRFEIRSAASLQVPNYGTIRGRNKADSGYYRRR